jgi:hypothetical protein
MQREKEKRVLRARESSGVGRCGKSYNSRKG